MEIESRVEDISTDIRRVYIDEPALVRIRIFEIMTFQQKFLPAVANEEVYRTLLSMHKYPDFTSPYSLSLCGQPEID